MIAAIALKTTGLHLPELKDMPLLILSTLLGHIGYFYCEYGALATVPVANITIILGFLPIGSVWVEKVLFRRKVNAKLILFMVVLIVGIFMVIGSDFASMRGGSVHGYLYCVGALLTWLAYLFVTEKVALKYGSIQIALYQAVMAWIFTIPAMVPHVTELPGLPPVIILELIYLGIVSEGLCFLAEVTGLEKLGPTISAVYSNFLPVTTAFFGLIMLHQSLVVLQCLGGVIVIISGVLVIREKDRIDRLQ